METDLTLPVELLFTPNWREDIEAQILARFISCFFYLTYISQTFVNTCPRLESGWRPITKSFNK